MNDFNVYESTLESVIESVGDSAELPVWKCISSSVEEPARKPVWDSWDLEAITFSIHDYCVDYFEEK